MDEHVNRAKVQIQCNVMLVWGLKKYWCHWLQFVNISKIGIQTQVQKTVVVWSILFFWIMQIMQNNTSSDIMETSEEQQQHHNVISLDN